MTFDVCNALDLNDDGAVDATEAGPLAIDLDGDGDVDVDDQAIAVTECTAILEAGPGGIALTAEICQTLDADDSGTVVPPTGDLTLDVCTALDTNADGTVDAAEAESLGLDLNGDGVIDGDDQAIAVTDCPGLLAPEPGPVDGIDGTDSTDGGADAVDGTDPVIPPGAGTGEPGTLVISKFVCTQIEEPTATVSDPVGVAAAPLEPEEGCVADSANFQIFINSDFTSDPIDVFVDGTATVNGVPSTEGGPANALFEPAFNVFFEFEITPGGVTTITVLNPADDGDGATPVADGGNKDGDGGTTDGAVNDGNGNADAGATDATGGTADGGTADGGTGGTAAEDDDDAGAAATDDDADADVSGLPSTGQGSDGGASGSAIVLLFGAMSMVALAAGFAWRQRRAA